MCNNVTSKTTNEHTLMKKYFIAKKHYPSSEPSGSHPLLAGGPSCLHVDGCGLNRGTVAKAGEGWGGCILKTAMQFAASFDSTFYE